MTKKIPFNRVDIQGNELDYIKSVIDRGHISGDSLYTEKCNNYFESKIGIKKSLLTTSCTHALEMSSILLRIKKDDEIILPAYTFVSTVNAFVIRGAKPIFADIRNDTLNIDESKIESLISKKTKAIIVVHYAGIACQMDTIMNISKKYNIPIIEDNAHGLFGKYRGEYLGTFGTFSTQSFHETKNFSCGEGGSLFLNDNTYIERAEIIREKGTNRSKFFRGQIDKYSWVDVGSSYLPSEILAAFLFAQLEKQEEIQRKRENIWNFYYQELSQWASYNNIRLPFIPIECEQSFHMFYLIMPNQDARDNFIDYLKTNGIMAVFHYLPLHLSSMGKKLGGEHYDCPITVDISNRLVRLPFYNDLDTSDIDLNIIYDYKL
tara:strand:+ start:16899 stop:18029 length:1131 start_codon:yes stop_codon:yes gene_type:complete